MPRVVVTTISGEPIRSLQVQDVDLARHLVTLIEALPDLPLYVEGEQLLPEQRASLMQQAEQLREATRRAEVMTPESIREATSALADGYEALRRAQLEGARELAVLVRTHNQATLEDGVKARFMLHQCLQDIDGSDLGTRVTVRARIPRPDSGTETPVVEGNAWTRANQRWQARHERFRKG